MKEALHLTTQTINNRLRWYRNFLIGVVGSTLIFIILAIVQRSWHPLLGFLFLIPLVGIFLYLDSLLVYKWQERILTLWRDDELDLNVFYHSMATIRMFPQQMYQSMLKTLPVHPGANSSAGFNPDVKKILFSILQSLHRYQRDRIIFVSLCYFFIFFPAGLALTVKLKIFLLGALLGPLILGFHFCLQTIRWERLKRIFLEIKKYKLEESKEFMEIISKLDWRPISEKKREEIFSQIRLEECL